MASARRPRTTYKEKTMLNLLHVFTSSNHGSSVLRYWPTWPIHICRPIWPMTHDPLTHCLLWPEFWYCLLIIYCLLWWPVICVTCTGIYRMPDTDGQKGDKSVRTFLVVLIDLTTPDPCSCSTVDYWRWLAYIGPCGWHLSVLFALLCVLCGCLFIFFFSCCSWWWIKLAHTFCFLTLICKCTAFPFSGYRFLSPKAQARLMVIYDALRHNSLKTSASSNAWPTSSSAKYFGTGTSVKDR